MFRLQVNFLVQISYPYYRTSERKSANLGVELECGCASVAILSYSGAHNLTHASQPLPLSTMLQSTGWRQWAKTAQAIPLRRHESLHSVVSVYEFLYLYHWWYLFEGLRLDLGSKRKGRPVPEIRSMHQSRSAAISDVSFLLIGILFRSSCYRIFSASTVSQYD